MLRMRIEPEIDAVSVVLIGDFNPTIFTPAWFALYGFLPKAVVSGADLKVAHKDVTEFEADWLRFHVDAQRCSFQTVQAPHVRVCDLAVRVFGEQLTHTPIKALGINREIHFQVRDMRERDLIGRRLAPVEPWGPWKNALGLDGAHGGMTSLTMSQVSPEGRESGGRVNVTVEPSVRIGQGRSGVYVRVNDHYVTSESGSATAGKAVDLLAGCFDDSLRRSVEIIDHLMSLSRSSPA